MTRHPDSGGGPTDDHSTHWRPARRDFLRLVGGPSMIALAGCTNPSTNGDDDSTDVTTDHEDDSVHAALARGTVQEYLPEHASVTMETDGDSYTFDPPVVQIAVGGTVEWTIGSGAHTVSAYHPDTGKPRRIPAGAESFDSGLLSQDESYQHTFEVEGVFDYYCGPHEGNGMVGSVIVGDPDPDEQPALEAPSEEIPAAAREEIESLSADVHTQLALPPVEIVTASTDGPDHAFAPEIVRVRRGGAVEWSVESGAHTVSAYHSATGKPRRIPHGAESFHSDLIAAGDVFVTSFLEDGVYAYYCMPHESAGMLGLVIVGDPDPEGDEPGLAEPQEVLPGPVREHLDGLVEAAISMLEAGVDDYEAGLWSDAADSADAPADAVEVVMTVADGDFVFDPSVARVTEGGTVTWSLEEGAHTATAYHPDNDEPRRVPDDADAFDSGMLTEAGETFEHTFEVAGVYDYYCIPHESMGMVASVVVGSPDPEGEEPGLADPQSELPDAARAAIEELNEEVLRTIEETADADESPDAVEVALSDTSFVPEHVEIDVGETVRWVVEDGVHTVTADADGVPDGADSFDSGLLEAADTYERTFEVEGTYDYYCTPHESAGMTGTIAVGDVEASEPAETVTLEDGVFSPDLIRVDPGETVRWIAEDSVHTVTAYHPVNGTPRRVPGGSDAFASEYLQSGDTYEHTFEVEGVYDYYCEPHEGNGMVASVIVGDPSPDPDAEPGLAEPGSGVAAPEAITDLNERAIVELGGTLTDEGGPVTATVSLESNAFSPDVVRVEPGEAVRWSVADGVHSVTAYHPSNDTSRRVPDGVDAFDSGLLESGDTFEHTFEAEGVYDYYCMPHESVGMVGCVIVGSPDPDGDEPGLAEAQSALPAAAQTAIADLNERVIVELGGDLPDEGAGEVTGTVSLASNAFSPDVVRIDPGEAVRWTVADGLHSVTAYHPDNGAPRRVPSGADAFDSGYIESGDEFVHTFEAEGVYDYYCIPHESAGMVGCVIVGDPSPDPDGEPGLAEAQSELSADTQTAIADLNERVIVELGGDLPDEEAGEVAGTVSLASNAFSPDVVRVDPGQTVRWTVADGLHSVTAYHPDNDAPRRVPDDALAFDSGFIESGDTFEHTFEAEGVYDYYCIPHESMGMVASVIVGSPDPEGEEPGLADPQSELPADTRSAIHDLNVAAVEELGGTPPDPPDDLDEETTENDGDDPNDGEGDGPGDEQDTDPGDVELSDAAEVSIPDRRFSPDLVWVDVGGTVTWTWADDAHTVTAYADRIPDGADAFDSGIQNGGASFAVTFDVEGVYDYYCQPHEGAGMVGSVIVGEPDPDGDEPGLSSPSQGGDAGSSLSSLNDRAVGLLTGEVDANATIHADELVDVDGEIDILLSGSIVPGEQVTVTARFDGRLLVGAPVEVEGDDAGTTDENGELVVTIPSDLDSDDDCRFEIRVDDARGRIEPDVDSA